MIGAIACGHKVTAQSAETILRNGGNAFDAAIAALTTMFISEPCMASLGGGGIGIIQTAEGENLALDFFCHTPRYRSDKGKLIKVTVDFGGTKEQFHGGHASIAVPGVASAIIELHKRFGSMPLKELLTPAYEVSKNGIDLSPFQHKDLHLLKKFFLIEKENSQHLLNGDEPREIGSLIKNEKLAGVFDLMINNGFEETYFGDIADTFFKDHRSKGGSNEHSDWFNYKARWKKTVTFDFANYQVSTSRLPSAGAIWLRAFLEHLPEMKTFLGQDHLAGICKSFERIRDYRLHPAKLGDHYEFLSDHVHWNNLRSAGTSHFNIIDGKGNAIGITTTIGSGSGIFIPGTGIYMNNMLGEEALIPGGLGNWTEDSRLLSMTTPTLVNNLDHDQKLILGTGGSTRIPYAIAQTLINHLYFNQDLETSIKAPRVFDDLKHYQAEPGFNGHHELLNTWEKTSMYFGGVHAISMKGNEYTASADDRREGFAKILE